MDKKLWQQVERIVDEAMQIDSLDRKTQLINEKCGDNAEVKVEVLKLLNSMEASGSFWEKMMDSSQNLITEIAKDRLEGFQSDSIPHQIGSYVIKKMIGQGGMGNVYLAEHESKQFNTKVALKIIRREVNQQERIQRFIQERKILSRLNHPNIARLFDGGISEDGRPYFVMEYIEGKPITDYCESNNLPVETRLKLFKQACEAVQFAHSNFIVHRDLKPDNVIVTREGTVKVLDFGIAKLLENEQLTERDTIETRNEHRFLSLNYAAPEQITLEAVTAATDVYTLGLLLYQLLTNKRPFQLHSKTLSEAEAIIRNSPPSKPSSETTEAANQIKGDLDSIVLKALRKESEHRYNSVALLIEDVNRHLTNRPVSARKGSFRYKTHKFFKRNIQLIIAAFLFTSVLVVFGTYHYQEIKEEREIAELEAKKASVVSDYLVDLFSAANPINNVEDTLNVYDLLSIGKDRIQTLEEPVTQINLLVSLGNAYGNIGDFKEAILLLSQADSMAKIQLGTNSYESAYIAHSLGNIFAQQRNFTEAAKSYHRALNFFKQNNTDYGLSYSLSLTGLGNAYAEMNVLDSAIIFSELAIKVGLENNMEYSGLLSQELNLAKTYRAAGKSTDAERIYREILADSVKLKKDNNIYLATVANNLAYLLLSDGRLVEAENYYRLALKNHIHIYGEKHPSTIMLLSNLAGALQRQGKIVDAEEALQKKLNLNKSIYGTNSWQSGGSYQSLGILYFDSKDYEQSKTHFLNAVEIFSKTLGDVHPWTIRANLYAAYSILHTNPERDLSEVFRSSYESLEIASEGMSYNFKETLVNMVDKLQKSERDMEFHINKLNEVISLASR